MEDRRVSKRFGQNLDYTNKNLGQKWSVLGLNYFKDIGINYMYSEEHEDPLYTKLSKILELTSLIFGHYKDTGQKERAHSLIVWVVSALQAVIENRQKLYIARTFTPETVRLAYMRAKANATSRYYIIPEAP